MTTQPLPERPNLEQLKRQAKDLLRLAQARIPDALARFAALPALAGKAPADLAALDLALHDAQSVVAREHGFVSWNALRERVEELTLQFDQALEHFVRCSTDSRIGRADRLLTRHPGLTRADFHAALVFGETETVRTQLARNPALATQPGGPLAWEPLVYVAQSRWAARNSAPLLETAKLLLAHGASPNASQTWKHDPDVKLPVLWAALNESRHLALGKLLLEAGANADDGESMFHAAEHGDLPALELLAAHGAHVDGGTGGEAWGNTPLYFILHYYWDHQHDADVRRGARWLLEHGANPNRTSGQQRETPLHAAASHWDAEMIALLLAHGADAHARRGDGRTALTLACLNGRLSAAGALRAAGAVDELTRAERFIAACFRGDREEALALREPAFIAAHSTALTDAARRAAMPGALETMLACGFSATALGDMGETALHHAAIVGNAPAARLLIAHGAPVDLRDRVHKAEPLGWCDYGASAGCGGAHADFAGVARALCAAGAPLPKPEELDNCGSDEVAAVIAEFLRGRKV